MSTLELGHRGTAVIALQRSLVTLGYRIEVDGNFGPKTLKAVQKYARESTRGQAPGWAVAEIHAAAANAAAEADPPGTGPILRIGAWCGNRSLANPVRDVEFAVARGINRLDIVVNDHSRWRAPRAFTVRDETKIERLASLAAARGIEVHLMSWIMPHQRYIDGAARRLVPLCERVGARSLQWDAEGPWMKAEGRMTYPRAARHIRDSFTGLACPMGATAIGYTPVTKFRPLAEICEYIVPQAYVTSRNSLRPETAPGQFHRRYTERFGPIPIVMGLAAYRQTGIPGYTPETASGPHSTRRRRSSPWIPWCTGIWMPFAPAPPSRGRLRDCGGSNRER